MFQNVSKHFETCFVCFYGCNNIGRDTPNIIIGVPFLILKIRLHKNKIEILIASKCLLLRSINGLKSHILIFLEFPFSRISILLDFARGTLTCIQTGTNQLKTKA